MRYQDQDSDSLTVRDFVPRSRTKDIWKVIMGFGIALAVMLTLNLMPDSVGGANEASLISLIAVSALCFYIVYLKQQNLDLVMNTEFQNMLFSQAAAIGFDFCLFVKRDGTITYSSMGIQKLFPSLKSSAATSLEGLFQAARIEQKNQDKVMSAIFANEKDRLIFEMTTEDVGTPQKYIISIDPLERPSGYAAIRGRKYVENAKQENTDTDSNKDA